MLCLAGMNSNTVRMSAGLQTILSLRLLQDIRQPWEFFSILKYMILCLCTLFSASLDKLQSK